ncbi:Roundabout-like protein 1 [Larimichthys crocea]|uniref:Uncharacterized protein n=1 Tax=Larimichthys crocea TaxID=215358 RepID=A0ACD3R2Y3_LARCR|nr:Roundabout-like protein 1 [Larimichthys crocea]
MSTDSNMSPAITHKRPRRHKQNQSGQQGYQPKDVFNDDSCMPLSFPSQMSHGDYKVRGATLPRMGSGEARGRRGSTGTHRVKEGACEQRESQDKHKTSQGGKGSSKSRQHSEFGDILLYSRPSFPSGQAQREPDGTNSSSFMSVWRLKDQTKRTNGTYRTGGRVQFLVSSCHQVLLNVFQVVPQLQQCDLPCFFLPIITSSLSNVIVMTKWTTVYSRVTHKCLPLAFYDTVCECVRLCMLMCAAKFHFQFRCVYPADSLQSVDKEPAMTARANVAKLRARLTEKVKLMSVNPEQLSIRGRICRETYG